MYGQSIVVPLNQLWDAVFKIIKKYIYLFTHLGLYVIISKHISRIALITIYLKEIISRNRYCI